VSGHRKTLRGDVEYMLRHGRYGGEAAERHHSNFGNPGKALRNIGPKGLVAQKTG
jgi:hypothetical protein